MPSRRPPKKTQHNDKFWEVPGGGLGEEGEGPCQRRLAELPLLGLCWGAYGEGSPGVHVWVSLLAACRVRSLALQGKDPSSPATCLDILHILSVSDANTNRLVMANVLDAIVLALTQGVDAMEDWAGVMKYPVSPCREGCASLLLNLALSDKTVEAVRAHSELQVAIQKALDDVKNLSAKTKQRLNDAAFRIKLSVQPVQPQASPRKSTASQHIMLSYCWAQQKQVLKIRQALGKRQYKIWLDVEQMSGSTGKIDILDSEATLT